MNDLNTRSDPTEKEMKIASITLLCSAIWAGAIGTVVGRTIHDTAIVLCKGTVLTPDWIISACIGFIVFGFVTHHIYYYLMSESK